MLPDPKFYDVDREAFLESEPLRNRLSGFYLDFDYPRKNYYEVANGYILDSFHSLFDFITMENSPSVRINPETSHSFSALTTNMIQLGTVIFADERFSQQKKVDAMFAVMLHEMFHKRYTNRDIALWAKVDMSNYYDNNITVAAVKRLLPTQVHVDVLNILEDHRIERLGLRDFPGYVFYFDALREYIFTFQKKKQFMVAQMLGAPIEYLMFKVLIPEMLPWFVGKVEDAYAAVTSLVPITRDSLFAIFDKIDRYVSDNKDLVYSDDFEELMRAVTGIIALFPKDVKNAIENGTPQKKGDRYSSPHSDFMFDNDPEASQDDDYDESIDAIKEELTKKAEAIEKAQAQPSTSSTAEKVRVERLVIIDANSSVFEDVHIYSPIPRAPGPELMAEAKTISNHISRDLGFLASRLNQNHTSYELTEGELDEEELYSINFSQTLFMEEEQNPGFELDFGILIDESGSMTDKAKIKRAIASAAGIAMACLDSLHVNMFVYGHSNDRHQNGHLGVELYEYINTKRGIRDWKTIFSAKGAGGNADGYAIAKVGEIMLKDSQCRQKVLVVISDGLPAAHQYGGTGGEKHVRQVVDLLEHKGIEVIQLCIDNIERSQYMFKHYIPYDKAGSFGKNLREIMQKKLQRFMDSF